jgi:transketolase
MPVQAPGVRDACAAYSADIRSDHSMTDRRLDELCVNTIRTLSIDAVQKANSGHPGAPMGAGLMAYVLWDRLLKHNPADPAWPDRDRFVLSAGHASMLLYSLLYLTGYGVTLDDIKHFRQWMSPLAGHPERGLAPGIEVSTGPLGQGLGNAVGLAMAERFLAATFNRPGHEIIDHHTYVIASDGDLMEGISHEAASLAGHQQLGKLTVLYDYNLVSLDGPTEMAYTEDPLKRFEAYGWHVQAIDGMDYDAVEGALRAAQSDARPSMIVARTHIGYGSPNKVDSSRAHGTPLGEDEIVLTKRAYGWPEDKQFYVPDEALAHCRKALDRGAAAQRDWQARFDAYAAAYPKDASMLRDALDGRLPDGWDRDLPTYSPEDKPLATRQASGKALNAIADKIPWLIGGSADLIESTVTEMKGKPVATRDEPAGRNIWFGVREHAMTAAMNGMSAHGGVIPYGGTFLVFSDYMRPSIRLASLSELGPILVYTHDSIGLGEDGPTHQPIEHLMALRAVPRLAVVRPADANESSMAWKIAIERRDAPTAIVFSRQALPILAGTSNGGAEGVLRGAYVLSDPPDGRIDAIIIATGSEVSVAAGAQQLLAAQGVRARVVSMPCWELFEQQDAGYRDDVLPRDVRARVSVEAGVTLGWRRWVGDEGDCVGIDNRFGASAPYETVMRELGFSAENVAARVLALAERLQGVRA